MVNLAELNRTRHSAARIRKEIRRAETIKKNITAYPYAMLRNKRKYSKVKEAADRLAILNEQYADTLRQIEQVKPELEEMFCTIDEPDRRAVMRLVYLNGHKPELVAVVCGLTPRSVYYHIKSGKEELFSRFPDRFRIE